MYWSFLLLMMHLIGYSSVCQLLIYWQSPVPSIRHQKEARSIVLADVLANVKRF